MSVTSAVLYLIRHGETEWSRDNKHTSFTDVTLTDAGVEQAKELGRRLGGIEFVLVLSSPMQRALLTCELAGLRDRAEITDDLREWDYGDFEGLTTLEIRRDIPDWTVWTHGAPNGESPDQVGRRVDRVIERVTKSSGNVALFAHGHVLRALTARWVELEVVHGSRLRLGTGTLSILGHERETRAVNCWNC